MKTSKKISLLLLVAVVAALFYFGKMKSSNTTTAFLEPVPELIQRGDRIQLGKEWDAVQNTYTSLSKAISKDKEDTKSRILLAQLYIKEARVTGEHGHYYPAALKVLDQALSQSTIEDDMKFLALTTKAGVQLSLHDFSKALVTGNSAALLNPSNAQVHGVLVDANVELGNYKKAVALSDRMLSIKPDIRSYSRAAYLREIHGDFKGSEQAMIMAVKAGFPGTEETAWAMLTLGDMYKEYGELDKALMVYDEILKMRPDYPFAVGGKGEVYLMQNKDEKAEKTLQEAMDIIPEVGFYISMAQLYKKQDRKEELNVLLDEIFVMLQEDTDSGHNMNLEYADLYLDLIEDYNKALHYAKMEYKKRPNNIDVNKMMAKVYAALDDKKLLKAHTKKAIVTNSAHPDLVALTALI